jgi:hypothetical protein
MGGLVGRAVVSNALWGRSMSGKPENFADLVTGKIGPSPAESLHLLGCYTVTQRCKQDGVRLWAQQIAADQFVLTGEIETIHPEHGTLIRLWQAFTQDDINYLSPSDPGVLQKKSRWLIGESDHASLNSQLPNDCSDIRRLSTLPIERSFVYVDVSDFSKHRPGQQALIIGSLIAMVRNWNFWHGQYALDAWKDLEAMLCIGDGYIFVFKDVVYATYFAAHLSQIIEVRVARKLVPVEFHFRMGVHVGPVFCFWDWGRGGREIGEERTIADSGGNLQRTELGDWNYIGDGINGGQRVLAAAGKDSDDVLFISGQTRQRLNARHESSLICRSILPMLINRGRKLDKHNNHWRVYELNHTGLCGGNLPAGVFA